MIAYSAWSQFVHAGNTLLFWFAPYFLLGVDKGPSLLPFVLLQGVYYSALGVVGWMLSRIWKP